MGSIGSQHMTKRLTGGHPTALPERPRRLDHAYLYTAATTGFVMAHLRAPVKHPRALGYICGWNPTHWLCVAPKAKIPHSGGMA